MQVYSGSKTAYLPKMMSLYQQCIRVLSNNIDCEYLSSSVWLTLPCGYTEVLVTCLYISQQLHVKFCLSQGILTDVGQSSLKAQVLQEAAAHVLEGVLKHWK